MERLEFTETLPYKLEELYNIVMDAENYTDFTNLIKEVGVRDEGRNLEGHNVRHVDVLIETPVIPVAIRYAADLVEVAHTKIRAIATKSPFKEMQGELTFRELLNGHTEINCRIEYETGWNPVAMIAAGVMKSQLDKVIEAAREYLAQKLTPVPPRESDNTPPPPGPSL